MKKEKNVGGGRSPAAISDPRFARVHTDPRFMRMPKHKTKVSIDKRFAHMFSDKNFSDPLGADKRGRAKKKKEKHMLQRYYKVGDDEEEGEGADEETQMKPESRGKGVGKTLAKSAGGKNVGEKAKSKELARPKFPGPLAPSNLGLEESDEEESDEHDGSDEEIELKTKLKGKEDKNVQGKKFGEKAKGKGLARPISSKPAYEESDEEENDEEGSDEEESDEESDEEGSDVEDDGDEEIHQKPKLKEKDAGKQPAKIKGKELPRPKHSTPIVEESDEEDDSDEEIDLNSDEEIDLNSDENEEELEQDAGRKTKNRKALIAQQDGDSEEEEEEEEEAGSESDEESSSSSSSSESEPEEEMEDPRDEEKVPTAPGAETRRFAMMNMDWEHIKAADLLMLMRSFQPKGGRVERVTVYPSEFGIEQMKAEEVEGPNMIFEDEDDEDEDTEVNMEKLRAYEKNKLKYYYAVVECDSKETANHLYTQCDGMEFERTSNTLDLRFIPDEMTFVREPRDVATEVGDGYKAPEFETRALQHSSVKLTWDDDEPTRVKALRRKFNADELNDMDFRDYLASESSEEEVDEEDDESPSSPERGDASNGGNAGGKLKKDKYRALLLGGSSEEVDVHGQKKKKGDVDMEVTFHTGLSELSEKLLQKREAKQRGGESVWEAYLRKKKEKKAQRKRNKNAKGSDDDYSSEEDVGSPRADEDGADPFFTHDDAGFDDPFFKDDGDFPDDLKAGAKKSSKEKQSKESERLKKREEKEKQKKEEERSKAELELLLMDDEGVQGAARGFNLKSKEKKKKEKGKKKKGGKDKDDDEQEEEDKLATADLTDPRFASLFTDHRYAIDPTNPQFRKSGTQRKILAEAQRRRAQKSEDGGDSRPSTVTSDGLHFDGGDATNEGSQDRKRKAELSSLVRSLKRKAGK